MKAMHTNEGDALMSEIRPRTRTLAAAGIVGPILFMVGFLVWRRHEET